MSKAKKSAKRPVKSKGPAQQIKNLGERIKSLRISKGYSNYENFAFDHDIPRAQFGRYERGEDLKFSSLLKVLEGLDISVKDFFSEGFD